MTIQENQLTVREGNSLDIGCVSTGYPVPNIKWAYGKIDNILSDYYSNITRDSQQIWLNFRNITRKNNGTYICFLNEKIKHRLDLIVLCKFLLISNFKFESIHS